jgi:hypothetical protein
VSMLRSMPLRCSKNVAKPTRPGERAEDRGRLFFPERPADERDARRRDGEGVRHLGNVAVPGGEPREDGRAPPERSGS